MEINVPNNDEKNIATVTHLGGTIFSFIPSLIVWILKKDDSAYLNEQAKEALNFQITIALIAFILKITIIGLLVLWIIWLLNIIFCIIAAVATSKGEHYRYPFCLRLIN